MAPLVLWMKGVASRLKNNTQTQTIGLIDPSLILSFSSIHTWVSFKGGEKSPGGTMPKEALGL